MKKQTQKKSKRSAVLRKKELHTKKEKALRDMYRGTPSSYKPEFCQELILHMAKGFSFESFAGKLRINRTTLYYWVKTQEDFCNAKEVGRELSRLKWEQIGIALAEYNKGNAAAFRFNMINRFREDWQDRSVMEHKGQEPEQQKIDWSAVDTETLRKIVEATRKSKKKGNGKKETE